MRAFSTEKRRVASTCGSRNDARWIGPATRCGKNETNTATSRRLRRARSSPRYTSIV